MTTQSPSYSTTLSVFLVCLTTVIMTTACASAPQSSTPFAPEQHSLLESEDDLSDRLRRSDPINPRDGAPYRTYELALDYGDIVRIVVESSELTPSITLFGPDGTLVGSTERTKAPTPATTQSGHGSHDPYGMGHGGGYGSFGAYGQHHYDPHGLQGTQSSHHYDGAEGRANLIRRATEAGNYVLVVSSRFSDEYGAYNLRTERIEQASTLTFPGDVTGYLFEGGRLHPTTGAPHNTYPLTLDDQTAIEFDITSRDFTPHLSIVDPTTETVLFTHVAGTGNDSKLLTELPAGHYELWTSSTQTNTDGRYTLRVNQGTIDRSEEFFLGDTFRSFLGWNRDPIASSTRSGESVTVDIDTTGILEVTMSSLDFDTYLILVDESGRIITEDRESGRYTAHRSHYDPYSYSHFGDARIYWPVEPGTYTLWATSFHENESGSYTLDSNLEELVRDDELSVDDSAMGALTQASEHHPMRYTHTEYFYLTVDETRDLRISVETTHFDPYIIVENDAGEVVAETEHNYYGAMSSPTITRQLPAGTYRIAVTNMGGLQFGTFTLDVRTAGPSGS